jgi:predicted branched-subunit amino acid permease
MSPDATPAQHEEPTTASFGWRAIGLSAAPLALAIGVFGVIFGAAAGVHMAPLLVLAMSLLVFSGTLQFATIGLLLAGASAPAIVATALALNARHLVLGAVLRPRIEGSLPRRALLSWFLIDESFGLAVAAGRRAGPVLLATGALFFVAWQAGTVIGLLGAEVAVEGLATAIFPVLFVGLTALTVRGRDGVVRVIAAALIVLLLARVVPAAHAYLPIIAAIAVALPGGRRR